MEWVDTPEYQRHDKCRLKTMVFVGDSQQDMHGEYADEQLANLQKRICLIEFLCLDLIIVYQGRTHSHQKRHRTLKVRCIFGFLIFTQVRRKHI